MYYDLRRTGRYSIEPTRRLYDFCCFVSDTLRIQSGRGGGRKKLTYLFLPTKFAAVSDGSLK